MPSHLAGLPLAARRGAGGPSGCELRLRASADSRRPGGVPGSQHSKYEIMYEIPPIFWRTCLYGPLEQPGSRACHVHTPRAVVPNPPLGCHSSAGLGCLHEHKLSAPQCVVPLVAGTPQ